MLNHTFIFGLILSISLSQGVSKKIDTLEIGFDEDLMDLLSPW